MQDTKVFETFITVEELAAHLDDEGWVVVDCRAARKPGEGEAQYKEGHIPGAAFAALATDLAGPVVPGKTGRHPLPSPEDLVKTFERLGISNDSQVVAYDASYGEMAAARLWWLLRWAGHDAVAVLDGGFGEWRRQGQPVSQHPPARPSGSFVPNFRDDVMVTAAEVASSLDQGKLVLVDSRAPDRYRGENETADPVGGHIPGALNLPFAGNKSETGRVLSREELKRRFEEALEVADPERVTFYCGSGVGAAQNVLSFVHAGLGLPKMYPGSWSDWVTDPDRPVEAGGGA